MSFLYRLLRPLLFLLDAERAHRLGNLVLRLRAWLNPWAEKPLRPADVGFHCFAEDPALSAACSSTWAEPLRAMTWQGLPADLELGLSRIERDLT